jgi:hypothetical protein
VYQTSPSWSHVASHRVATGFKSVMLILGATNFEFWVLSHQHLVSHVLNCSHFETTFFVWKWKHFSAVCKLTCLEAELKQSARKPTFNRICYFNHCFWSQSSLRILNWTKIHERIARGGHKLPEVSLGPSMLNPSTTWGGKPLKRPQGRFRDGPHAGQAACGRLLPFWTSHAYAKIYIKI